MPRAPALPATAATLFCVVLAHPAPAQTASNGTASNETASTTTTDPSIPGPEFVSVIGARSVSTASAGTKSPTPLLETPQSISVVDRSELDLLNATTLNQALRYTAGVSPDTRGSTGSRYDNLNIRGFQPDQYLDGLKLINSANGYGSAQIDVTRLDRVEVIKGPASVLYGQASPGGIVALSSKLPTLSHINQVEALGGSFGYGQLDADLGGALTRDRSVLFRIDGVLERGDTEIAHTRTERLSVSPSVRWMPDARTDWTLLYAYQRDPESGSYGALPLQGTLLPNPYGRIREDLNTTEPDYDRYSRTENAVTSLFTRDLGGGWSLHQNTRFLHLTTFYRSVSGQGIDPDFRTMERSADVSNDLVNNTTLDTRVQGGWRTGPVSHALLFGVDYQHTTQSTALGFDGTGAPLDVFAPVYGGPVTDAPVDSDTRLDQDQTGLYGQDALSLGGLRLLLSGRYDWVHQGQYDKLAHASLPTLDDGKFTGRAGLLYLLPFGLAPYASYSTSFQLQGGTDQNGNALPPTQGKQEEVGLKVQPPFLRDTLLTVSLFNLTETNVATQSPTATTANYYIAAGEVRSRGVEFELHSRPLPPLQLTAAYTYLDNLTTKDQSGLQGTRPYGIPRQTASALAVYTFDRTRLSGFGIGAGVRYLGQSFNGAAGDDAEKIPSATLIDLIATYDFSRLRPSLHGLSLDLNVRNLFDHRFVQSCYSTIWCWYGDRRDAQAALRYRF